MLSEQMEFDLDHNYLDLVPRHPQERPVSTPRTQCPRCLARLHMSGSIGCCIQCGYEDYGADCKPDVVGLTAGSSLATLHGMKTRDRQRKSQQLYDAKRRGT